MDAEDNTRRFFCHAKVLSTQRLMRRIGANKSSIAQRRGGAEFFCTQISWIKRNADEAGFLCFFADKDVRRKQGLYCIHPIVGVQNFEPLRTTK